MKPLDVAAREGDWASCGLAFVGALDGLSPEKALAISTELAAELGKKVVPRQGRWMQFIERADDSLALASTMQDPDRLIVLASAVKDTISAIAMCSRQRRPTMLEQDGPPDGLLVMGLATQPFAVGVTDGSVEKREAWLQVHRRLVELPDLRGGIGREAYEAKSWRDLALRASEAGII